MCLSGAHRTGLRSAPCDMNSNAVGGAGLLSGVTNRFLPDCTLPRKVSFLHTVSAELPDSVPGPHARYRQCFPQCAVIVNWVTADDCRICQRTVR